MVHHPHPFHINNLEHFIVWARNSGLSNFRKLWGSINEDQKEGTTLKLVIQNSNPLKSVFQYL